MTDSDDKLEMDAETPAEPTQDAAPVDDAAPAPAPAAPVRKRRRFPLKSLIALAIVVAVGLPVYSTLQPAYYERYPQLRTRIDNWKQSTHARIPCSDCHMDPGVTGFLGFAVKAIPAFYSQLIFGPGQQNILTAPDRFACQKCHTGYRTVSPAGDLLIPHKAHVEVLQINCVICHKNLVHSLNADGYNKPEMQTCLSECHNGQRATNQCSKCHTRKQVPPGHLKDNWLQIHSTMVGKINCGQCHGWSPDYCRECHSHRPPTHVGNWKFNHQFEAKKLGTKGCLFCHAQTFCTNCHYQTPSVSAPVTP